MRFCQNCGGSIEYLTGGGCGGMGSRSGCPKCNVVYEQTNGGIVAPLGGPQYRIDPFATFEEAKLRVLEEDCKPFQIDWKGEDKGKWVWRESRYGESHYYPPDQGEQAKKDHRAFVQAFEDTMSAPVHCGRKARSALSGRPFFRCRVCNKTIREEKEDECPTT